MARLETWPKFLFYKGLKQTVPNNKMPLLLELSAIRSLQALIEEEKQQKQAHKLLKMDERKRSYPLLHILHISYITPSYFPFPLPSLLS